MRPLIILLVLPLLLLKGLVWLLFVPLSRGLLWVSERAGVFRLPLLVVTFPVWVIGAFLDTEPTGGRELSGDIIRPTFTLPFAFRRGPWRVSQDNSVRRVVLELGDGTSTSTLEITIGSTFAETHSNDEVLARAIDQSLVDPPLPNGMRWAGLRITSFLGQPLTCAYVVWKDGEPRGRVIQLRFRGDSAHEAAADDFVSSVMPELPRTELMAQEEAAS